MTADNGIGTKERITWAIAIAAIVIPAGMILYTHSDTSSSPSPSTSPASNAASSDSPSSPSDTARSLPTAGNGGVMPPGGTTNPAGNSAPPAQPKPAAPRVIYLADLTPVGGIGNDESVDGTSVQFSLNTFASYPMTLTYAVPSGFGSFTSTIALDPSSTKPGVSVSYRFSLGGSSTTLQVGESKQEHVQLRDASQLTISVTLETGPNDHSPGHVGRLVFGDAAFRR
jgi:hypothetical protein